MAKIQDTIINAISDDDMNYLIRLANLIEAGPRMGNDKDTPEGVRYIQMSDTLAQEIVARLREITGDDGSDNKSGGIPIPDHQAQHIIEFAQSGTGMLRKTIMVPEWVFRGDEPRRGMWIPVDEPISTIESVIQQLKADGAKWFFVKALLSEGDSE